jgi:hypothetical protein
MVSPWIVRAALALLLAGCQGRTGLTSALTQDGGAADLPDDQIRFGPDTTWQICGTIGQVEDLESLAVSPDGRFVAAGGSEASIWDLRTGAFVRQIATDGGLRYGFSHDGQLLALTGDARSVHRGSGGLPPRRTDRGGRPDGRDGPSLLPALTRDPAAPVG